jgi:hypothetical protein
MSFGLYADVFCHDFINPPARDRGVDIDLELTNPNLIDFTKKGATSSETVYSLKIRDTQSAGFRNTEEDSVEAELNNLLLAFNLLLPRVCLNTHSEKFSPFDIRKKTPKPKVKGTVARRDQKVYVNIVEEPILISDTVHATVGHRTSIEETKVVDIFRKLQGTRRTKINQHSSLQDNNLKVSFESFEKAMWSFDRRRAFEELFQALEKVTNMDGIDRKGDTFDSEASKLSGEKSTDIECWRHLYNRLKHPSKSQKDVDLLYKSESFTTDLLDLRKCVQTALLSKI